MNRLIFILFFLLILVVGGVYYYYSILPDKLSEAIVEERLPKFIPKKYSEKAYKLKREVQEHSGEIERHLEEKNVSKEKLVEFVEKVEYKDVEKLIENAENADLDSAELAFQYIKENFDFEDFPIDSFKEDFLRYYNKEDFERLKKFYLENEEQLPILFPVIKKSISKFLNEKKDSLQ